MRALAEQDAAAGDNSLAEVWDWLAEVPDPEIPVISILDLGIVRDVRREGDTLVVDVSPTYTGCPAVAVIDFEIERKLREKGVQDLRLKRVISPPWTTDWITPEGREKLRAYGIAPPVDGTAAQGTLKGRVARLNGAHLEVACPQCGSIHTRQVSAHGSTACKSAWVCEACLEPFDYFKCI